MPASALKTRGALLLAPYADEPAGRGLLTVDPARYREVLRAALRRGFQVNTHAIGDGANRFVLDASRAAPTGRWSRATCCRDSTPPSPARTPRAGRPVDGTRRSASRSRRRSRCSARAPPGPPSRRKTGATARPGAEIYTLSLHDALPI